MEWINEVIFASLSPNIFEAAVAEFLGYDNEFDLALVGDRAINNAVNSGFNAVRRLSVDVDLGGCKMLVAVDGGGVRGALGSVCPRFR